MASVTYKNQPAINATKGNVPINGTKHVYTVKKVLWPEHVEAHIVSLFIGRTLHVCCGKSLIGDVRLDIDRDNAPDIVCDAANMDGFVLDREFDTVLCDPPYNGDMQWNHNLLSELHRVASKRIIFQHWFIPANAEGRYKKAQSEWGLTELYAWMPRTYFGRAQLISVFDHDATGSSIMAPDELCVDNAANQA